jgi:hypothetical protein
VSKISIFVTRVWSISPINWKYRTVYVTNIVQRFQIGYSSQPQTTESVVANARNVRRQIGMITTIFELEALADISSCFRFIDKRERADRIITEVTKDIRAMFT